MRLPRQHKTISKSAPSLEIVRLSQAYSWANLYGRAARSMVMSLLPALFLLRTTREEIYNILWALVFAFATLNILSLGARHVENERKGLTFGEILAIMVVLVSVVML